MLLRTTLSSKRSLATACGVNNSTQRRLRRKHKCRVHVATYHVVGKAQLGHGLLKYNTAGRDT
jgi:hypothetical protein